MILIAGPCTIESPAAAIAVAAELKAIAARNPTIKFIFKASFDKANRTKLDSFRGIGKDSAIEVLRIIRQELNIPVTTDIHHPEDVAKIIDFIDLIQIPAFLSRQTDLLLAAASSGKSVNIKKMQMMSPEDMEYVVDKVRSISEAEIYITERGTSFGYNDLVVDFRGFETMTKYPAKLIMDISHSLQQPSKGGTPNARNIAIKMARAAVAFGVDGIFVECTQNPEQVRCDKDTTLYLSQIEPMLSDLLKIDDLINKGN